MERFVEKTGVYGITALVAAVVLLYALWGASLVTHGKGNSISVGYNSLNGR